MKRTIKKKWSKIIPYAIITIALGLVSFQRIQYYRTVTFLTSMAPQHITVFRIYPKSSGPFGTPVEFRTPEPIIEGFFQSITDIRSYWGGRYTVASEAHGWFLVISTEDQMIQISCAIPTEKKNTVVGTLGKYTKSGGTQYGRYQSQLLYQWYQKYSHRWLKPGDTQQ